MQYYPAIAYFGSLQSSALAIFFGERDAHRSKFFQGELVSFSVTANFLSLVTVNHCREVVDIFLR